MLTLALITFLVSIAILLLVRFNAVIGTLFGFSAYHHSLILVPILSEHTRYSDWVSFSHPDISFISVFVMITLASFGALVALTTAQHSTAQHSTAQKNLYPARINNGSFTLFSSIIALSFAVALLLLIPSGLSKRELYSSQVVITQLLQYPISILFLYCAITNRHLEAAIGFLCLLLLSIAFYSRSTLIIPILGWAFIFAYNRPPITFAKPTRIILVIVVAFIGLFGKEIAISARLNDYSLLSKILSQFRPSDIMTRMEGYAISEYIVDIVNRPVPYDFSESVDALFQLLIIPDIFGADSSSFTNYLSYNYRPNANYGLAYSYYGEGYAVAGVFGVIAWSFILCLIAFALHYLVMRINKPWVISWAFYSMGVICFYHPRNSLEICLSMLRLAALSTLIIWGLEKLWRTLLRSKQTSHPAATTIRTSQFGPHELQ